MLVLPHSGLFIGPSLTVVISGPHIQVLDTLTGDVRHSTKSDNGAAKSGPVRCFAVDNAGKHLLSSAEDKVLKLWEIEGLKLVNQRELPKRPTAVQFTSDGQTILVSDKFGDVFSYPFHYTPPPPNEDQQQKQHQRDSLSSHENPSGGQLILGHTSLLNAFLLSPDEKYIITADRDEHIRVSWFPQGYNIHIYCLGHAKFVSAIHNPRFAPSDLVSGGGDSMLKIWDWMEGVVKHEIGVWGVVEPLVVIRGSKWKRGADDDSQEGRRKGKGKKSKGKGKNKGKETIQNLDTADLPQEGEPEEVNMQQGLEPGEGGEKILVIHKIETLSSQGLHHLVFSAVGATALFTTKYPQDGQALIGGIHAFDFGQPVLDFFISIEGLVWVLLDGNWSPHSSCESTESARLVRILEFCSGQWVEVTSEPRLLVSLNTTSLLQATRDDIKNLDLYADLTNMPKSSAEAEQEHEGESLPPAETEKMENKKILGRMKNKQAVQERLQRANVVTGAMTPSANGEDDVQERDTKKTKALHEKLDDGHGVVRADE